MKVIVNPALSHRNTGLKPARAPPAPEPPIYGSRLCPQSPVRAYVTRATFLRHV